MKDRLSKISKRATHALCLLAACGLTYSCADEYKLDDESPKWLGKSIYHYLEENKGFENVKRLITDLGLKDVLSKTGSRTLFVADDAAFQRFYEQNAARPDSPWGNATGYDKLTLAQKKLLLNSSMLNNAYLMEMMSRSEGEVTKGANMRKVTSVELTDSVPMMRAEQFPTSHNPNDKNYWSSHKLKERFYVVSDNSTPMMVFFTDDFMAKAGISASDFEFIMGQPHEYNQYYIYNNKVVKKDITCQNGYVHHLQEVLLPQPNMAELIRNNGNTSIFSHILDRFSAPYYDAALTKLYKDNVDQAFQDSIFVRKYYSQATNTASVGEFISNNSLSKGPDGESPSTNPGILKFDPAWNQITAGSGGVATDMAAMFVPTDDALRQYFLQGEGRDIMDNYAVVKDDPSDEAFLTNLDQIPLSILNSLVSNLMQKSFVESVPSKFTTILDQANDNLFTSVDETKSHITEKHIANNGVVYVMDKVYPPVDYAAVTSPAYIGDNYKVMKFAIYNGEGSDGKNNLLNLNYYAYLRAKGDGIKFSLFLPSDEAMKNYVDPLSIIPSAKSKARVLSYEYNASKSADAGVAPLDYKQYAYDPATGIKKPTAMVGQPPSQDECLNRLGDILETHTIVHDVTREPEGVNSGNEYFLSKSGSPIRIHRNEAGQVVAQGAMQIRNEQNYPGMTGTIPGFYGATTEKEYEKTNGTTYCTNAPIQPAVSSVYKVMSEMGNDKFFELCSGMTEDILTKTGVFVPDPDATTDENRKELNKYFVFSDQKGLDLNVSFFTKFNYTVYVPTDAAIEREISERKLPTWESIAAFIEEHENDPKWDAVDGDPMKGYKAVAAAQVACLIDFVRGHFQDYSEFADQKAMGVHEYNSATLDKKNNKFITIRSIQEGGGNLALQKDGFYDCRVTGKKNLIARDYVTNVNYAAEQINLVGSKITSSAYSVMHEIDGTLRVVKFDDKDGIDTYEQLWNTPQKAKATVANFRIKNK